MNGPKLLKRYLDTEGLSTAALGKKAGVDPSLISRYKRGTRRPDVDRAFALEEATEGEVPARAWCGNGTR